MLKRILIIALVLFAWNGDAQYPTYQNGHIINITFSGDMVLIRLDVAHPGNCASSAWNWMAIPAANKPIQAFVLALQARGALSSVMVTVYTDPPSSTPFCTVNQIDPWE
jgi:hypothetical protein